MSRSSFVEVNITNPTKLAQDSQDTANDAVKGVTDLNDPNLMSVIEKQNNVVQFAGLTSQYNVLVQNAKDEGINTDSLTTAYNNLNKFMIDVLTDPDHASDVDRKTYKNYQDAYNSELAKIQTALKNNTDGKFTSAASATSQAASTASQAASQAQSAVDYTNSQIASQASAVSEASKSASEASSQANSALDTATSATAEITKLKGGSTLTIAELENGLGTKVSNDTFTTYQTQTASQFAETVKEADFQTYQTQTSKLIEAKVDNGTYQTDKTQTAKDIASKVSSSDFETYQTQTDGMIASKVSTADFNNLTISNRNLALGTATPITFPGKNIDNQAQVGYQFSSVIPLGTVVTVTFDVSSSTGVGEFVMQFYGTDSGSNWQTIAKDNLVNGTKHVSVTLTTAGTHLHVYPRINFATGDISFSNFIISESSKEVNWTPAPEDQATQTQITQLSDDINLRVTKGDLIDEINLQAGNTLISSSGQLTLSGKSVFLDSVDPVIMKSANIDTLLVGKKLTAADISANTFTTNNGTFTVDSSGAVVASNLTIRGITNLVYNAALLGGNGSSIPGWGLNGEPYYSNTVLFDGLPAITWNGDATGRWDNYANSKLQPVTQTGIPYSASIKFRDYGSASGMLYTFTLGFFSAYDANTRVGYLQQVYTANGSDSGIQTFTINNAIAPSNAKYVAIQLYAYNGKGHAAFSSPMLTQTAQSTGYQPDAGNVVSAGTVLGSIISGSTINATTFNGGDLINNSNNTSNFYPFTIEPTGKASTTLFNSMDALRTEMSGGGLRTMYRAINASGSQYEAYDGNFSGDAISLNSGFTNGRDTSFSQSVSGNQLTGQVVLSPLNGIHLWGSTQAIHFSGLQMNGTGITFNSYGNIIADQASTWWRVTNFSGSDIANFGTDTAGSNVIQFNRELDVGNIQINTGHTVTSADKGAIHFAKGGGGTVDIYAGAVHYTSLVNSSLLSVKRDVEKADTAYWAQLVNAIDLATYQYKADDNTSHIRLSGIVDDVNETKQWQLPDIFINRDENGKLSGIDNSVLLNAALATIQEQQKQISTLNGHNMELESRLNKLEDKIK